MVLRGFTLILPALLAKPQSTVHIGVYTHKKESEVNKDRRGSRGYKARRETKEMQPHY